MLRAAAVFTLCLVTGQSLAQETEEFVLPGDQTGTLPGQEMMCELDPASCLDGVDGIERNIQGDRRFSDNMEAMTGAGKQKEVLNGTRAAEGEFAAVVALYGKSEKKICTGTLIRNRVVLTAFHCARDEKPEQALFGANINEGTPIAVAVDDIEKAGGDVDLALVHLAAPAPSDASPVPLVPSYAWIEQSPVIRVVGYGLTESFFDPKETVLRRNGLATTPLTGTKVYGDAIVASPLCQGQLYFKDGWFASEAEILAGENLYSATDAQFYSCAPGKEMVASRYRQSVAGESLQDEVDTCKGDSGGPAFVLEPGTWSNAASYDATYASGRYFIAAVTKKAVRNKHLGGKQACGNGGVYTLITPEVVAWVEETIADKGW